MKKDEQLWSDDLTPEASAEGEHGVSRGGVLAALVCLSRKNVLNAFFNFSYINMLKPFFTPQSAVKPRFASKFLPCLFVLLLVLLVPDFAMAEPRTSNLYWAPPSVTVGGHEVDKILNFIFALTAAVFFGTQIVFIYYLIKYRRQPGVKAHYSHGNNRLEVIWTTIPTLIFIGLAIYSNRLWFNLHSNPPANALQVDVVSYQFGWDFRYPGTDGVLSQGDVKKFSTENKFGLESPAESDDFTSTELVIPANRPVHVYLRSRDVIHSFYVPEFRLYQDAVPGRTISWVWFEVTRPGNFELACSQLCGKGHYNMKAPIKVLAAEEFDKWYAEKSKKAAEQAKAKDLSVSGSFASENLPEKMGASKLVPSI